MSDLISRQAVLEGLASIAKAKAKSDAQKSLMGRVMFFTEQLPSVTPQQRSGRWERMSDLPNDVDDRFECSRCGNIVHHRSVMDLRTFSRWCGRCGSYNDYKMEVEE